MSFIAGLLLGFIVGVVVVLLAERDDIHELRQLRRQRDIEDALKRDKEQKTDG